MYYNKIKGRMFHNNNNNAYYTTINWQIKRIHDYNKRTGVTNLKCNVCGDVTSESAVAEKKAYLIDAMKGIQITMNAPTNMPSDATKYKISVTYYESPKICGNC